nr:Chain C, MERS-CoV-S3 [Middle East respiratory syndrome-related coronavirus]6J2J_F Chain F, MERS-CoV-S3 [Middle East respiratory syndrome-related coronavirus]
DFTCSQISP